MAKSEVLVATMPKAALASRAELASEQELGQEITDIEFRAEAFVVASDEEYASAAEFGKLLKQKAKQVTDFFKPMKDNAYQAHKAVCDREKSMLVPLRNAEKIIKKAMGDYTLEQERKRREAEAIARKAAEEERERKLREAAALERAGDASAAEMAMTEAVVMDEAAHYTVAAPVKPKVTGVSTTKDWEIESIDPSVVPVAIAGMEIRPVDKAAVMRLIRATKGKIEIPGITYKEVAKMSFRR